MPRRNGARDPAREHPAALGLRNFAYGRFFVVFVVWGLVVAFHGNGTLEVSAQVGERSRLLLTQTLASCTYDDDCVANAYCWIQKTCLCKEGYLVHRNRSHVQCLRIATNMGDPCTENVQCRVTFTPQAECRNNACVCSPGSHFKEGRCYESVGIGHVCQTSHNCYVEGSESFCVDGYCACLLQHHPSSDRTRCLRSSLLGQDCSNNEECIATNSRCFDVCGCNVDYVLSMDGKRCLKAANLIGDHCEEDSQCREFLKNARCSEGTCTCNMNFKRRGSVCHRDIYTRMLGKYCDTFSDCVQGPIDTETSAAEVTRVGCIDGVCSCAQDFIRTDDGLDCIGFSDIDDINGSVRWRAEWIIPAAIFTILRALL